MNNQTFQSMRKFTLFDFYISHGQLLLRSNKNIQESENIDIIFFGVKYMQIPVYLNGIALGFTFNNEATFKGFESIAKFSSTDSAIFTIESEGQQFFIVAGFCKIFKNQLEFSESSLGFNEDKRGLLIQEMNIA
jgi:hypothetical protein